MTDGISKPGAGTVAASLIHSDADQLRTYYHNTKQGLWRGYGHSEVQSEVRKLLRPGLSSLALNLLFLNIINSYHVMSKMANKTTITLIDSFSIGATILGLAGGINSYISEVWRKGIKEALDKSQNPLMANKLGKVTLISGALGAGLTFVSSMAYFFVELDSYEKASKDGNTGAKVAIIIKQIGNITSILSSSYQFKMTGQAVLQVIMDRNMTWRMALATKTTQLAKTNFWLIAGTVLTFIGGLIYEHYNPEKIFLWIRNSIWGINNKNWDFLTTQQKLAEAVLKPKLEVMPTYKYSSESSGRYSYQSQLTSLKHTLTFFGVSFSRFKQNLQIDQHHPLAICMVALINDQWVNMTDIMLENADFTIMEQGLKIEFIWPMSLATKVKRTEWTIEFTPDIANNPLESSHNFFRINNQGSNITELAEDERLTTQGKYPLIVVSNDIITMGQNND